MQHQTLQAALGYEKLLAQVYSDLAAFPIETGWLQSLARFINLDSAMFILEARESHQIRFAGGTGSASASIELPPGYRARALWGLDPGCDLPPRQAFTFNKDRLRREPRLQPFLQNCLQPFNLASLLCINLDGPDDSRICIRLARSDKGGGFSALESRLLEALSVHLHRAVSMADEAYRRRNASIDGLQVMLENLRIGAAVFDEELRLIASNSAAQAAFKAIPGLGMEAAALGNGRPSGPPDVPRRLGKLLNMDCGAGRFGALVVNRPGHEEPLRFIAGELADSRRVFGKRLLGVFVCERTEPPGGTSDLLMELYGFSRSEAQVAALLASGASIDVVAATLCRSRNTIRSHARAIYDKAGVDNQAQLTSLILSSPASFVA